MIKDEFTVHIQGHLRIVSFNDPETREDERVELDMRNAVHPENMSVAIARALSGRQNGHIFTMHFGTGGATIDPLGNIIYASPNTEGAADLNIPVYMESVDAERGAPTGNQMAVRHVNGTVFSDIEIRCVIDKNEPVGQVAFDSAVPNIEGGFTFDEIGLKTDDGLLLTHICFSPVSKTANRLLEVVYTLRIRVA